MSRHLQRKSAATLAGQRPSRRFPVLSDAIARFRESSRERRQQRELLAYLAADHRAAADLGKADAQPRTQRTFGRS